MPSKSALIAKAKELGIPEGDLANLSNAAIQDKIAEALAKKEPGETTAPPVDDVKDADKETNEDEEEETKEPPVKEAKKSAKDKTEEAPVVEAPQKATVVGTERIKFTEDITNYYIAGLRITAKKGEVRDLPKTVALYLRQGGKAI